MQTNRIEQLQSFLSQSPPDPFVLFALAMEYRKLGDRENARTYYEQLVQEHTGYVGTYYHFASFELEEGNTERAQALYSAGIKQAEHAKDGHAARELKEAQASLRLLLDDE